MNGCEASHLNIRQANLNDLEVLVELRLALLREAGNLESDTPTAALAEAIRQYLTKNLPTGKFVAWVAEANGNIVGPSGVVMFEKPPINGNLSGLEAYIMKIYTVKAHQLRHNQELPLVD